ncbi:MAG TPA: hypothetical protein VFR71_00465 [Methyloceanibacter sp.]|nr:hypothetical protein [Methyloceanibacter sp.]
MTDQGGIAMASARPEQATGSSATNRTRGKSIGGAEKPEDILLPLCAPGGQRHARREAGAIEIATRPNRGEGQKCEA